MRFGHFAHEGIKFRTIDVVPSASLKQRYNKHVNVFLFFSFILDTFKRVDFFLSHLVGHLHTVLIEPIMVGWFPQVPISEGHHVPVGPGKESRHSQVIHTSPHITGGCNRPKPRTNCVFQSYSFIFWVLLPYPCTCSSPASFAPSSTRWTPGRLPGSGRIPERNATSFSPQKVCSRSPQTRTSRALNT